MSKDNLQILVLDDEPIVGKRLRTALEKNGHVVEVFEDSRLALRRLDERDFDIIVTDPTIPGTMFLNPVYFPSITGAPAYLSNGVVVAAHNSTAPGTPVLVTNSTEEPVATEATSFDNLKSLFR